MSFSKAKIQRFNELQDCTPSPAKYNVCTQEKIKLGIISKPESYKKQPPSSKNSDTGSVHSTPCFQTPTVPLKRKKLLGISFRTKTPSDAKLTKEEELKDKIVECNNKDLFIQDLTEQIEELTALVSCLNKDKARLEGEKHDTEGVLAALQNQQQEESFQRAKDYQKICNNVQELGQSLRNIRQLQEDLKSQNHEYNNVLTHIEKFQVLYNTTVEQYQEKLQQQAQEFQLKQQQFETTIHDLKKQQEELMNNKQQNLQNLEELKTQLEDAATKLQDRDAKIQLLEENLNDVTILMQLQMKEKLEEVEETWKQKLEEKEKQSESIQRLLEEKLEEIEISWKTKLKDQEKEAEAILKECQEISEYNIIQSEVEKNHFKKLAEDAQTLVTKNKDLEEELNNLKSEKHAYELSISTFKDTIEVLKKRLINSDRDVEQLKEELERSEEKILKYEQTCADLTSQLSETQLANEELEMQYESTSKLMRNEVETIEKDLLEKVDKIKEESQREQCDKELMNELLERCREQQLLLNETQKVISRSSSSIESLELKQEELETELKLYKTKLEQESEEAAEIRKKYIEKSGKYDELAQQFEQILQELDQAKGKIHELDSLVASYQQQLETYQVELQVLTDEKQLIDTEVQELRVKYADLVGHHNHNQKIKHLVDLKTKSSELFKKNVDLEAHNHKLSKTIEKLLSEIDDLRKLKKNKGAGTDKENLPSPKCIKNTQSPAPLKNKN